MAVAKTILKNTNQESVVKVAGTAAAATIDLSVDLLAGTQALDGDTQRVNIIGVQWAGLNNSTITITRNSVNILTLNGADAGDLEFGTGYGFVDNIENASDIVVTIAGAEAQCYLTLRKASGYASKVETAVYGAYDNESAVGS
jgi:hypothetical protein